MLTLNSLTTLDVFQTILYAHKIVINHDHFCVSKGSYMQYLNNDFFVEIYYSLILILDYCAKKTFYLQYTIRIVRQLVNNVDGTCNSMNI